MPHIRRTRAAYKAIYWNFHQSNPICRARTHFIRLRNASSRRRGQCSTSRTCIGPRRVRPKRTLAAGSRSTDASPLLSRCCCCCCWKTNRQTDRETPDRCFSLSAMAATSVITRPITIDIERMVYYLPISAKYNTKWGCYCSISAPLCTFTILGLFTPRRPTLHSCLSAD